MDIKQNIINRLRETKRENIDNVIDYMENHEFFTRGCHQHHYYEGGLADHSWQTYQLAMKEETDNKAGLATDIDVKLGGNVSYNTLLHLTLAGTTKTGTTNYGDDRDYQNIRVNMALFGLGATHYFENNIFITASCGISQFHANDDIAVFSAIVQSNTSQDINTGFGFQVGGGKEWWVSDNWGIGASAALLYGFASNLADARESSLGITLRLSATWN